MHFIEIYNYEHNNETHLQKAEVNCLIDYSVINTKSILKSMKNNSEYLLKSLLRDDPDQEWLDT